MIQHNASYNGIDISNVYLTGKAMEKINAFWYPLYYLKGNLGMKYTKKKLSYEGLNYYYFTSIEKDLIRYVSSIQT